MSGIYRLTNHHLLDKGKCYIFLNKESKEPFCSQNDCQFQAYWSNKVSEDNKSIIMYYKLDRFKI